MNRFLVVAFTLMFSLCGSIPAKAGALLPCLRATLSPRGNALVLNDLTFNDPDESHARKIETSTYRIFRRYRDLNYRLRLEGPDQYWAEPYWQVTFTNSGTSPLNACSYTLVTGDVEYLVLIGMDNDRTALSIYHPDHAPRATGSVGPPGGVLVRQVPLSDLAPEVTTPQTITDDTPQWFAGGTFSFSADERTLIYTTRTGKKLQISLLTGEVQR